MKRAGTLLVLVLILMLAVVVGVRGLLRVLRGDAFGYVGFGVAAWLLLEWSAVVTRPRAR